MSNNNTLTHNLKRGIFNFSKKLGMGFYRPAQKFICEMVFGLLVAKSCYLTEIARKLEENIALDKTVERLSRNLMDFEGLEELRENYFSSVKRHFNESTILIIDDSDIAKPCSKKLESLCRVRDGSKEDTITTGYWYAGVSALTAEHKQPIPVYSHVYSSLEPGYKSNNDETLKSLKFLSAHFAKDQIRALDAGYDAGYIFDYFIPNEERFILRTYGNRNCIHKGETILISTLATRFKGKYTMKFEAKNGRKADCKISIVPITLPKYPNKPLNLVICKGLGKEPLMLITSLDNTDKRLCVTVTKVYLMRWRIEEFYKFKKQGFGFEKFLVRSLQSIRNLDFLLTAAIGYLGTLSEKVNESIEVIEIVDAAKRLYGLAKFTFYALSDGLAEILTKSTTGIRSFFRRPKKPPLQLVLWGCDKYFA